MKPREILYLTCLRYWFKLEVMVIIFDNSHILVLNRYIVGTTIIHLSTLSLEISGTSVLWNLVIFKMMGVFDPPQHIMITFPLNMIPLT